MSVRTNVSYFGGFVVRICRTVSTFSFTSNQGSIHILGYAATVKFNELTDSVILICYCFHLFTHYIWLLSGDPDIDPPPIHLYLECITSVKKSVAIYFSHFCMPTYPPLSSIWIFSCISQNNISINLFISTSCYILHHCFSFKAELVLNIY